MSIISSPTKLRSLNAVTCSLCSRPLSFAEATVGPLDASGNQTFACNNHLQQSHDFITGWADFNAAERQELLDKGDLTPNGIPMEGWENDWNLY